MTDDELKKFFYKNEIIKALMENDLDTIYNLIPDEKSIPQISKFLIDAEIYPWEYFKKKIPDYAFFGLNLHDYPIELNKSIEIICDFAFFDCYINDDNIYLADTSVKSIGHKAFGKNEFVNLRLPETIRYVSSYAFDTDLCIDIPKKVEKDVRKYWSCGIPEFNIRWV